VSAWVFPRLDQLPSGEDLIAIGADLAPATILDAYRAGYFPMPVGHRRIGWFSPDPRGVLEPSRLRVSRSLRRSSRRYEATVDQSFNEVIQACADPARPHGWIDRNIIDAYVQLHAAGHAHSIEVWDDLGLAGGLYGISIGGLFAGESMFHRRTDASKVALMHLVDRIGAEPGRLIDVQWKTPHLASLGVVEIARNDYARRLEAALLLQPSQLFDH
jgi:leucyl/phenylalanyl-tRNA--protein transferase